MCFRIEQKPREIDFVSIVAEQQVEILERFAQEERLHHVTRSRVQHILHVANGRVSVLDARVRLERLEYGPAHVLVRGVAGQRVKVVQTLDELGSQQIVRVVRLDVHVRLGLAVQVKVRDFGRQLGGLLHVRLVACLQQVFGQLAMGDWHAAVQVAKQQGPRQVAGEVIHFRLKVGAVDQLANVDVVLVGRGTNEVREYAVDGGSIVAHEAETFKIASCSRQQDKRLLHLQVVRFFAGLQPLLQQVLIVRVAPGAQRDGGHLSKSAGIGVDENRHKAVFLGQLVNDAVDAIGHVLEMRVARTAGQITELQLDGGHLARRTIRRPLGRAGLERGQIHVREGNAGRRVETRQQSCAEINLNGREIACKLCVMS